MEPIAEAPAPNWAEITTEPQCPLCEYMLRGLNVARCPECGFRFNWSEVLNASRRDHPYLFEHHPDRNIWSFNKTALGAMRPRRFWTQLHPAQPGAPHRLLRFWLLGVLALAATLVVMALISNAVFVLHQSYLYPGQHIPYLQRFSWERVLETAIDMLASRDFWSGISQVILVVAAWPWLTYLALQIFQISMRKAKVRPVHVMRCVVYGLDLGFVAMMSAISFALTITAMVTRNYQYYYRRFDVEWILVGGAALVILLHTDRLAVAYRLYLRFDHPRSVAISAQLITLLTVVSVLVLTKMP